MSFVRLFTFASKFKAHMQEKITRVNYPSTCLAQGPIETIGFERESNALSGVYLDYALACACDYSAILLSFLPGLVPHQVKVGATFEKLETWAPTQDQDLAKKLVKRFLNRDEVGSTPNLIEIITKQIGGKVSLLKPTYEFAPK